MSWSIGYDSNWKRDIGYGVPATCDFPGCGKSIDRGLSCVCGGEPYGGERGRGLYFCGDHLQFVDRSRLHASQLCPRYSGHWFPAVKDFVIVGGASDANCLRGLERKGFLRREPIHEYSFSITEAGLAQVKLEAGKSLKL